MRTGPALAGTLIAHSASSSIASAQGIPRIEPGGRSGEPPPLQREAPRPLPPPVPILPRLPPAAPGPFAPLPGERVFVREIRVTGSTVVSPAELAAVIAPYVNREVSSEDLEALRVAMTRLYVDRVHLNYGAVLLDHMMTHGITTCHN